MRNPAGSSDRQTPALSLMRPDMLASSTERGCKRSRRATAKRIAEPLMTAEPLVNQCFTGKWLGRQDSNLGMAVPKTAALPLGDAPICAALLERAAAARNSGSPVPGSASAQRRASRAFAEKHRTTHLLGCCAAASGWL
ncbi:hypothetical protein BOS5A_210665 [Bosea sp. EC-HK365B]|nr:hypothetical protein BOSE7B_120527 [Bosea sp. 7B]CAD5276484.1 hypothetical protein BOSE21B_30386 [Bosea sp. 21B]VVT59874.1 hypothetical protein BOS5A_210665 [Bosea sp. EC-HK365B]